MKRGIKITREYENGFSGVCIQKSRGKLTLDEIQEALHYGGTNNQFCGRYVLLFNATENTIGGNGLWLEQEQKGDSVLLYELDESSDCPVCGKLTPPYEYCPNCGERWKSEGGS